MTSASRLSRPDADAEVQSTSKRSYGSVEFEQVGV